VIHNANHDQPQASVSPPPHVIETVAGPPPPPLSPTPPPPPRVSHAIEENFVAAIRAAPGASWQHISWAMIPGGGSDTRNDDALLVTHGYEACDVMDRYPGGNRQDVAHIFYSEQGFNMESIASFPAYSEEMSAYMDYAARYLCQRKALGWDVRDEAGRGARRDAIYHRRLTSTPEVAGLAAWDDELTAAELAHIWAGSAPGSFTVTPPVLA
jgi:hypothetical protein